MTSTKESEKCNKGKIKFKLWIINWAPNLTKIKTFRDPHTLTRQTRMWTNTLQPGTSSLDSKTSLCLTVDPPTSMSWPETKIGPKITSKIISSIKWSTFKPADQACFPRKLAASSKSRIKWQLRKIKMLTWRGLFRCRTVHRAIGGAKSPGRSKSGPCNSLWLRSIMRFPTGPVQVSRIQDLLRPMTRTRLKDLLANTKSEVRQTGFSNKSREILSSLEVRIGYCLKSCKVCSHVSETTFNIIRIWKRMIKIRIFSLRSLKFCTKIQLSNNNKTTLFTQVCNHYKTVLETFCKVLNLNLLPWEEGKSLPLHSIARNTRLSTITCMLRSR